MGWLFVPGLEESNSASGLPWDGDTELFATSNGKPSPRRSSWRGWAKRAWTRRLSGTISQPSTASLGVASWISSLADTRANPSPSQGSGSAPPIHDTCGRTFDESSPRSDRASCSSRTSPDTSTSDSEKSSPTWLSSDSEWKTQKGALRSEYSARLKRARLTAASASSFSEWPTPDAGVSTGTNVGGAQGRVGRIRPCLARLVTLWPTTTTDANGSGAHGYSTASGRHAGTTLTDKAVRLWNTPRSRDWKGKDCLDTDSQTFLPDPTTSTPGEKSLRSTRVLNPRFVEWLMGFPTGWTGFEPLETRSFREWQQRHSEFLQSVPVSRPPRMSRWNHETKEWIAL